MKSHSLYCIFFLSLFSYTNTIEEKVLAVLPPESKIESIEESVIDGLFKVYFGDLQPLYVSEDCLLYTSPSPRDRTRSRMPSSA